MRLSDGLAASTFLIGPKWTTFDEMVSGMINGLVEAGRLPEQLRAETVRHVREREVIAGTAMVDIGVSIPHARVEGIDGVISAVAVSPDAVYYVTDGLPISIVVLVLSSPSLSGEHLNFLAALSLLLQSEATRAALRKADCIEQFVALVRGIDDRRG